MKLTIEELNCIIQALKARQEWLMDDEDTNYELPHIKSALSKLSNSYNYYVVSVKKPKDSQK